MNPLFNPFISFPFLKNFIFDPGRLERLSPLQLERYRDRALRKIVRYAYDAPLYRRKYKDAGVHPSDIKGIKDIKSGFAK